MSFDWNRKILHFDLASTLAPDQWTPLLHGLKKMARDARAGRANDLNNVPLFFQYAVAVNFALNLENPRAVLELGTGYSSLLWGTLAPEGLAVYSVDGKPMGAYDISVPLAAVADRVRFVNGSTLTREQLLAVYDGRTKDALFGCPAETLRAEVGAFIRRADTGYADLLGLGGTDADFARGALDLLFDGDGVRCLSTVLPDKFEADARYCLPQGPTALDRVLEREPEFDAVFFDCGEFSTMAEWNLLHERIRPGGLAMFHDVFFPKSIKSFLLCAVLCASPDWEILYVDRTTPQGLVVARRAAGSAGR